MRGGYAAKDLLLAGLLMLAAGAVSWGLSPEEEFPAEPAIQEARPVLTEAGDPPAQERLPSEVVTQDPIPLRVPEAKFSHDTDLLLGAPLDQPPHPKAVRPANQ